jgi:hypothetical protein
MVIENPKIIIAFLPFQIEFFFHFSMNFFFTYEKAIHDDDDE